MTKNVAYLRLPENQSIVDEIIQCAIGEWKSKLRTRVASLPAIVANLKPGQKYKFKVPPFSVEFEHVAEKQMPPEHKASSEAEPTNG